MRNAVRSSSNLSRGISHDFQRRQIRRQFRLFLRSRRTFKWNNSHVQAGPRPLASRNSCWNSARPWASNKPNSTYLTGIPSLTPSTVPFAWLLLTREMPCRRLRLIRNFVIVREIALSEWSRNTISNTFSTSFDFCERGFNFLLLFRKAFSDLFLPLSIPPVLCISKNIQGNSSFWRMS